MSSADPVTLSRAFRLLIALDFFVIFLVGAVGLLLLTAFAPYMDPERVSTEYVKMGLLFLVLPLVLTTVLTLFARRIYIGGETAMATMIMFIPLVATPLIFFGILA